MAINVATEVAELRVSYVDITQDGDEFQIMREETRSGHAGSDRWRLQETDRCFLIRRYFEPPDSGTFDSASTSRLIKEHTKS
jgi:hypothetical protein